MGKLFGTDGVRGRANEKLTALLAYKLGRAGAHVLTPLHSRPRILVGRDTRISGGMLEAALAAGICSAGADAVSAGVLPTPAIAMLTRTGGFDAGVMISASHNPFDDNGIKFFSAEGYKLSDELEGQIEAIVLGDMDVPMPQGADVGTLSLLPDGRERYIDYIVSSAECRLDGLRVVLDCANGAASGIACEVFRRLGAEAHSFHDAPDGLNINRGCGSTHIGALQALVARHGGFGFAFDGDADRCIAVDEGGRERDGDYIMAICAERLKREGRLAGDTLVATVMSNLAIEEFLAGAGIKMLRAAVGDRYVLEKMREGGFALGGEASGHIIFLDRSTTGDGLLSAVTTACAVAQSGGRLDALAGCMTKYPQLLINLRVAEDKRDWRACPPVAEAVAHAEALLAGRGRVLVRPSGTEPLLRVMVESRDEALANSCAGLIADAIRQHLSADPRANR